MKMTKREFNTTLLVAATAAFGRSAAMAQAVQQSASGSTKSSSQDLAFRAFRPSPAKSWEEQLVYQRGIEAVIWAMPAVSMAFFRDSAFKAYGITYHNIIAFSHPAQPRHELLTSNAQVPYVFTFFDLRDGPIVMDVPASNDKSLLYGQVVDAWQVSIADIGPSGADKGTGGRYGQGERLTDAQIAGVVFVANQAEIAAGESALRRTQSRSVQALARRIVAEHGQVNQEIIALTQRLAATLQRSATSDALTNQSVDDLARLNEVETRGFDEAYLDREVTYLQQLVNTVDTFIRSATSAELKMLLVRFRPFFILHLDQAQRLSLAIGTPEIGR
jgi:putative membrane protein